MIPIPLSWALLACAGVFAATTLFYEGVPFLIDGRVDHAYDSGQMDERRAWEELRRQELAARDAERQEAQAKINMIETEYWRQAAVKVLRIAALERAVETEPAADPACSCPSAISKRLRDALNGIGR